MIGLDIGTYSIKAVELEKTGDSSSLVNFKIQERVEGEPLSNRLKKFLTEARFNSRELNISVSGHLVLARLIELPQMNEGDLKNAVKFEVEKFVPFNIENAILDYQIVSKNPQLKKITVLVAGVKSDFVKNYIDMISQAGFMTKGVDIDGIALTNAFLNVDTKAAENKVRALLNIGDAFLNLSIVDNQVPFVLRDISGAGAELTTAIAKGLSLDKKEAYQVKHSPPSDKKEVLFELMRPVLAKIVKETRLSIGYFENQFSKGVESIYLSGGSSRLFGLREFLSESLDIQVESWDPFASIRIGEGVSVKALEDVKPQLPICVGLAIRDD